MEDTEAVKKKKFEDSLKAANGTDKQSNVDNNGGGVGGMASQALTNVKDFATDAASGVADMAQSAAEYLLPEKKKY